MQGKLEKDETVIGGQEEGVVGRKNQKKKLEVLPLNAGARTLVDYMAR